MPVIGFLNSGSADHDLRPFAAAFRQGLTETGYIEGQNVAIEYRWAEGQYDRLPALAADLVRRSRRVSSRRTRSPLRRPKAATTTIPIVFATAATRSARVWSQALTGRAATSRASPLLNESLERSGWSCCTSWCPQPLSVACSSIPTNPDAEPIRQDTQAAARALGLQIHVLSTRAPNARSTRPSRP